MSYSKPLSTKLWIVLLLLVPSLVYAGWFHKYEVPLTWWGASGTCLAGTCIAFESGQTVGGIVGILGTIYTAVVGGGLAHEIRTGTSRKRSDLWHGLLVDRLKSNATLLDDGYDSLAAFLLGGGPAQVRVMGGDYDLWRSGGTIQVRTSANTTSPWKRDGEGVIAAAIDEVNDSAGWPTQDDLSQAYAIYDFAQDVWDNHGGETGFCVRLSGDDGVTAYSHVVSLSSNDGADQTMDNCINDNLYNA